MRAIDIEYLEEGQKLAKPVYDEAGRILLHKGATIKKTYIARLRELGIPFVYIEDELVRPLEAEELIHDSVRTHAIKIIKNTVEKSIITKEIDLKQIHEVVNKIIDDILSSSGLLVSFLDIRSQNLHLYNHSVSVAVLSIITGMVLQLDQLKLKHLGMGAILHDIGKGIDPGEEHTTIGFDLLRQNEEVNLTVAHVAYQHHERYDGLGFPRQLRGEQIHLFAAITGVANFYDNLVAPKDMNKRLFPYQAIERVVAESGRMFHPKVVMAFTRNIAPYPIGSLVRLNTGHLGVVIGLHENYPTRPIIKVVTDKFGGLQNVFPEIDLLEEKTIFIKDIITEQERKRLGI